MALFSVERATELYHENQSKARHSRGRNKTFYQSEAEYFRKQIPVAKAARTREVMAGSHFIKADQKRIDAKVHYIDVKGTSARERDAIMRRLYMRKDNLRVRTIYTNANKTYSSTAKRIHDFPDAYGTWTDGLEMYEETFTAGDLQYIVWDEV